MFCENCQKEVLLVWVQKGAATEKDIAQMRLAAAKQGKLILFNPPPGGPYRCSSCRKELTLSVNQGASD